jgi:hypothetical protein
MLELFTIGLILNEEKFRIRSIKEKTPATNQGFSTIPKNGVQTEYAHHYNGFEIYFKSFSFFFLEKIFGLVFIKIIMEISGMFLSIFENKNELILNEEKFRIRGLNEKTQIRSLGFSRDSPKKVDISNHHFRRTRIFMQMHFTEFAHV